MADSQLSTGLPGLDRVLHGLVPGDSVVWQVESLEDFTPFVVPYCTSAIAQGRNLIYFRFADHEPLVPKSLGRHGLPAFRRRRVRGLRDEGSPGDSRGGAGGRVRLRLPVQPGRASGTLIGCSAIFSCSPAPASHDSQSLAYYPLIRHQHSFHAWTPIAETTPILIDVYRHKGDLYLHPTKVEQRFSSTMNMLHRWDGDLFQPVMESSTIAEILTSRPWFGLESVRLRPGKWTGTFFQAEETWESIERGELPAKAAKGMFRELLRMMISRDDRLFPLVERYLTLSDVLEIWKRMIGSGLIGGKSVGMLLARAILKQSNHRWNETARRPRLVFHRLERFLFLSRSKMVVGGCGRSSGTRAVFSTTLKRPNASSSREAFPNTLSRNSPRCSNTSGNRRSLSVRAVSWKTTTATPSRANTRACSAPIKVRTPSGCRTSCRRSRRFTPAP